MPPRLIGRAFRLMAALRVTAAAFAVYAGGLHPADVRALHSY